MFYWYYILTLNTISLILIVMRLADYMKRNDWARSFVAWKLGVSEPAVTRYLNGDRLPNAEVMVKIYELTKGNVQPNDFYPLRPKRDVQ